MNYISTRGGDEGRRYGDIVLEGLATDGGLYVPQVYPKVDAATLQSWRELSYPDLAVQVMGLFIDDIDRSQLRELIHATYTVSCFGRAEITPLRQLEEGLFIQELSNGPTLAFKDIAMQWLGTLFEFELARRGQQLNILGATSGDTGSAAQYAMRGRAGIRVFMLSPHGRMSAFQQAQMFSLMDGNIHNLCVQGVFDDCQDIVKTISEDLAFKRRYAIGTVNSINWARLLAQVVYYFYGYFRATAHNQERVSFAVPSGNFGNICAGHVARMMGCPIERLMLATNENDVLDEFFRTGVYRIRSSFQTVQTSSPSMDISKASNFERFIFDLTGRDDQQTRQWFGSSVRAEGVFQVSEALRARLPEFGIISGRSTHQDRLRMMRMAWERYQTLIDPHTADGLQVATTLRRAQEVVVVLETALPAKFEVTVREALQRAAPRPAHLHDLEDRPRRFDVVPVDAQVVKDYIASHV